MTESEEGPVLRSYVIIGHTPEGDVVHVRHTVTERGFERYRQANETLALEDFENRFPGAVPVKPVSKTGTGGMGWSGPYNLRTEDDR